jgi:uncharacterized protein
MKKPNLIAWVEIPATKLNRAVDFYSSLLKTTFQVEDYESEKMACFPGGEGAIIEAQGYEPSSQGVIVSLTAAYDLDTSLEMIEKLGGRVLVPKTKIEADDRDFFAVFLDTEGNRLGLYGK